MPRIDDSVRAAFPGWSDAQIEEFHDLAKAAEEESEALRITIAGSDIGLAMVACELGWDALLCFLDACEGSHLLDAEDIMTIAHAARYLRINENINLYHALYGSAAEATSKKTSSARKKTLKALEAPLEVFDVAEV